MKTDLRRNGDRTIHFLKKLFELNYLNWKLMCYFKIGSSFKIIKFIKNKWNIIFFLLLKTGTLFFNFKNNYEETYRKCKFQRGMDKIGTKIIVEEGSEHIYWLYSSLDPFKNEGHQMYLSQPRNLGMYEWAGNGGHSG